MKKVSPVCFLTILILGFAIRTVMAQDLAKLMPDDVKVLVDNDRVRVLEVIHKPGSQEPMHSHPAYVTVFLSATKLKYTTPDGKTAEKDRKAGEVTWSGPATHAVENVETTHAIVVELKK